jgi:hypothetical protein
MASIDNDHNVSHEILWTTEYECTTISNEILRTTEKDCASISHEILPNPELKEQLAKLQHGFIRLTSDSRKLTITLQSEQHVKKQLAKNLDQLQENLDELKGMVELKSQGSPGPQEQ